MADGLKLSQLATLIGMMGEPAAQANPGQAKFMSNIIGSGQSSIQAEAEKKARKDAKKKKGGVLGTVGKIAGVASMIPGPQQIPLMAISGAANAAEAVKNKDYAGAATNVAGAAMGAKGIASDNMAAGGAALSPRTIDDKPKAMMEPMSAVTAAPPVAAPPPPAPVVTTTPLPAPDMSAPPPPAYATGYGAGEAEGEATPPTVPTPPTAAPAPATSSAPASGGFNLPAAAIASIIAGAGPKIAQGVEQRNLPGKTKLLNAAREAGPEGPPQTRRFNQPMTTAEARKKGHSAMEIRQMKKDGRVVDEPKETNPMKDALLAAIIAGSMVPKK